MSVYTCSYILGGKRIVDKLAGKVWKGKKIRIKAWVPALLDTALDISSIH
jgi:hypothetical protein